MLIDKFFGLSRVRKHHVIRDMQGRVVNTYGHDQIFSARRRLQDLRRGGGAYRLDSLKQGDPYDEIYTPGQKLRHGKNDGLTHQPGED